MRIISKFQDYYDSALAYGFENDRVLVRHNKSWDTSRRSKDEVPPFFLEKLQNIAKEAPMLNRFGSHNRYENRPKNRHLEVSPVVFWVAGQVVKALWVLDVESPRLNAQASSFNMGQSNIFLPQLDPAKQYSSPTTFKENPVDKILHNGPIFDAKEFENVLSAWLKKDNTPDVYVSGKTDEVLNRLSKWLDTSTQNLYLEALESQVSIAVATPLGVAVNPSLRDWKFFKHWDAPTCMQELSMFVGNISLPDAAPLKVEDKHLIQSHGFDERSFRKQPTKKATPKVPKRPHPDTFSP